MVSANGSKRNAAEAGLHGARYDDKGQSPEGITNRPFSHPSTINSQHRTTEVIAKMTEDDSDGGWEVVGSKASRRNKRRKIDPSQNGPANPGASTYPGVSFDATKPARVQAKSLQELILYVLADGTAPTWLAVKNKEHISKVVVLMVPGLDKKNLQELKGDSNGEADLEGFSGTSQDQTQSQKSTVPVSSNESRSIDAQSTTNRTWLQNIISVKGPGDSSMSKVHSPLQALLIAPSADQKGKNQPRDERSFQAVKTHIVSFIHSGDDLRDADFPVHPAAFDNDRDADLERDRREKTFQSTSSGWVDTTVDAFDASRFPSTPLSVRNNQSVVGDLKPYAVDCEMVLTDDEKYSLARISVLDWHGKTILDKYVKPTLPIKNYFTQYSGITPQHLEKVTTKLEDIQKELLALLGPESVLLGHSLDSDLNALKLTHPYIVDTSIIYPHPRGLPLRSSLKFLANRYLKREIQKGGANGHDSVEDARAVLDLVRLKCEKGPRWGTLDANGESIFRRIARAKRRDGTERTSAIVEYGTPERGFGREATYKIACEDDDQIVQGILKAALGDSQTTETQPEVSSVTEIPQQPDQNQNPTGDIPSQVVQDPVIPPGGVDFIWSRLHDLEAIRGWNTAPPTLPENPSPSDLMIPSTSKDPPSSSSSSATPTQHTDISNSNPTTETATATETATILNQTITQTLTRISTLWHSLPSKTLLLIYTGTGDMRPYLKLQQLHAQYRKEFKVKNWDQLSVKWTDVEEQALRGAVDRARSGVGVVAVK